MRKTAIVAFIATLLVTPLLLMTPVQAEGVSNFYAQTDDWDDWNWEDTYDDYTYDDYSYDYDYDYDYDDLEGLGAAIGAMGFVFFAVWGCVMLGVYIYYALSLSTIAKKLGEENSWMAWVPILNVMYMCKLGGFSLWLGLLVLVPIVNFFFFFFLLYVWMKIAERRGFPMWVGILLIVPVIGIAVPGYIAWGNPSGMSSDPAPVQPASPPPVEPAKPAEPTPPPAESVK